MLKSFLLIPFSILHYVKCEKAYMPVIQIEAVTESWDIIDNEFYLNNPVISPLYDRIPVIHALLPKTETDDLDNVSFIGELVPLSIENGEIDIRNFNTCISCINKVINNYNGVVKKKSELSNPTSEIKDRLKTKFWKLRTPRTSELIYTNQMSKSYLGQDFSHNTRGNVRLMKQFNRIYGVSKPNHIPRVIEALMKDTFGIKTGTLLANPNVADPNKNMYKKKNELGSYRDSQAKIIGIIHEIPELGLQKTIKMATAFPQLSGLLIIRKSDTFATQDQEMLDSLSTHIPIYILKPTIGRLLFQLSKWYLYQCIQNTNRGSVTVAWLRLTLYINKRYVSNGMIEVILFILIILMAIAFIISLCFHFYFYRFNLDRNHNFTSTSRLDQHQLTKLVPEDLNSLPLGTYMSFLKASNTNSSSIIRKEKPNDKLYQSAGMEASSTTKSLPYKLISTQDSKQSFQSLDKGNREANANTNSSDSSDQQNMKESRSISNEHSRTDISLDSKSGQYKPHTDEISSSKSHGEINMSSINDACPICLDEFYFSDILRELPCKHIYHPSCVDAWLTKKSARCPLCKFLISKEVTKSIDKQYL